MSVQVHTGIGLKARMPNPELQPLAFLIGSWATTGTHPEMPNENLPGTTSFAYGEGGAYIIMRSQTDHEAFPDGIAVFGSDNALKTLVMCWFDERGVSRIWPVVVGEESISWHHDDPKFMQRITITRDERGDNLISKGEMAIDGGAWGADFSQVFARQ